MNCVFCTSDAGHTMDHIPPKAFFDLPYPDNLITVPACEPCRLRDQADDRLMRNLFVSFLETESHRGVASYLAARRDKSFGDDPTLADRLMKMMVMAEVRDHSGKLLGYAPAFNLKQPMVDRFIERVARGAVYAKHEVAYFPATFDWMLNPDMARQMVALAPPEIPQRHVGDIFHCIVSEANDRKGWHVLLTFFQKLHILCRFEVNG